MLAFVVVLCDVRPVLLTTADHVLLDRAMLDHFLARYRDGDVAVTERVRFFVAYDGAAPVACGCTEASGPATPFLGLWAGAVLPTHRGRGLYRAIVAARARYARRTGYRFLTVDAGPMSRPILERLGFERLTTIRACTWRPNPDGGRPDAAAAPLR